MINPKELRIGNWVEYCGVGFIQVDAIDIICATKPESAKDIYNPIPLTVDILERCGFDGEINSDYWEYDEFIVGYYYGDDNGFHYQIGTNYAIPVKYLHHLQNIFYWLRSGKELNYAQ